VRPPAAPARAQSRTGTAELAGQPASLLRVERTVLDHVAIGTRNLADGWQLFGGLLGGTWAFGGDSPGYWWGQLQLAGGPMIELLTPTGPDGGFLERFLSSRGAGPHHFNFHVPDIEATLTRVRAAGIEPVGVDLSHDQWKEAFLHPKTAHGIVIQVAQQSGPGPRPQAPADLPPPGEPAALALVEHHVADLEGAVQLFGQVLEGDIVRQDPAAAELTWPGRGTIRLVRSAAEQLGAIGDLHFTRPAGPLSPGDLGRAQELAERLGISLQVRPG
jgi:methylmalonyl-CoA/ethylmalonyl-CoA epimerase